MPFDWNEFLTLARELAAKTDDASKRTAISRAYYCVFNLATARADFRALSGIALRPGYVPMPSDSQPWRMWRLDMTNGLAIDDLRLAICHWRLEVGARRSAIGYLGPATAPSLLSLSSH